MMNQVDDEERAKELSAANSAFAILIRPEMNVNMLFNSMFIVEPNLNQEFQFVANYTEIIQKIVPDFVSKSAKTLSPETKKEIVKQALKNLQALQPFVVVKSKEGIEIKSVTEDITMDDLLKRQSDSSIDETSKASLEQMQMEALGRFSRVTNLSSFASSITKGLNSWMSGLKPAKDQKDDKGSSKKHN